jgi:hypothetical protein
VLEDLASKLICTDNQQDNQKKKGQESRKDQILNKKPPTFLLPENRMDKNMRKMNHEQFDNSSLYISNLDYK